TSTYTVQVSNGLCILGENITINVTQTPIPIISATQTICAGNEVSLKASGGATFSWLPSASLNMANVANPMASPVSNTTYTVTIANGNCKATDSVKVIVNPLPVEAASPDTTIQITESVPITVAPVNAGSTYIWLPETGLSCNSCPNPVASPLVTTTYSVTTTDALGCSSTEKVTVNVIDDCGRLFVPNAFSPNGDGHNDILLVYGVCIVTMDFIIFDRWGNKIFESNEQATGWDGTYKGQRMNADTYTYLLNVKLVDGSKITKSGNVGLVR
ncbi:MAG TPA: gliding motility-associated C-terminal domain-containing protein, partial [Bacteroidia bacterium]|nr:gliding motility-associated C-terminal domain-containing protein [Bacteroidia bacterium]